MADHPRELEEAWERFVRAHNDGPPDRDDCFAAGYLAALDAAQQQPSEPTDEEVEAAGRVIFELTVGPGHSWDTIEGPGRDLWRRNTRAVLRAALCAARKARDA